MADSNLTKKDVFNFLNLGRKIVVSGAGAVLDAAKSKIAELTDSEEAFQKRIATQVQALVETGFTEAEARKAVDDRMKGRLDRAFEKCAKPSGDSAERK
jgi:Holliday junction resolvasome RuvABC DNA-binding subunit